MFTDPTTPNLTDFYTFVTGQGVPTTSISSTSEYLSWSLAYGENIALYPPGNMPSILYVMAVYNLGLHHLLKVAQDVSGTFFTDSRATFGLLAFSAGPVISAEDGTTNDTLQPAEWMKTMTLQSLGLLKTPWGRAYLEYAQSYGPNIVGVS